jgi:Transcriptional Coactivator p15 (PC4)
MYYALSTDRFVNATIDDDIFNVRIEEIGSCFKEHIDLSAESWLNLSTKVAEIDLAVERLQRGERVDVQIPIGRKVHVTLIMDYMFVDLRDFYFNQSRGDILPSGRGIALTFDEWNKLKDLMPEILEEFPILSTTVSCSDNPTHCNLEGAINCFECNFFRYEQEQYYLNNVL